MKYIISLFSALILFSFVTVTFAQDKQDEKKDEKQVEKKEEKAEVKGTVVDDGVIYGAELNKESAFVTFADLIAKPEDFAGKTIKISGNITDVCQTMGCWMNISDGTNTIKIMTLHKFFMPKDANGKAEVEGTFKIKEETEEHAKEMNEESKNSTVKTEDIKGPQKVLVVEATGVKVLK